MVKVFFGPFQPFLEETLASELLSLKQRDPLAPVAIIVPTAALRKRLMRRISDTPGHKSWANLSFFTTLSFALTILKDHGRPTAPFPPKAILRLILQDAIKNISAEDERANVRLSSYSAYPGYINRLLTLFSHFITRGVDEKAIDKKSEKILFSIFREFEAKKKAHDIVEPENIIHNALPLPSRLGERPSPFAGFFLYGFYDLNPLQGDLVRSIGETAPLVIFSPALPNERCAEYAMPTISFFRSLKGQDGIEVVAPEDETPPGRLASRLFAPPKTPLDIGESLRVVTVSGSVGEAYAVAHEILREKEKNPDLAWHQIGVASRDISRLAADLDEILSNYFIPAYIEAGTPLYRRGEARAFLTLLSAIGSNLGREDISTLLASEFFSWRSLSEDDRNLVKDNAYLFEMIARERNVISGVESWEKAWDVKDAPDIFPHDPEEPGDSARLAVESFISKTRPVLLDFLRCLAALPPSAKLHEYSRRITNFLETYIIPHKEDHTGYEIIKSIIASFSSASSFTEEIRLPVFIALLQEEIRDKKIPATPDRDAVFVSDFLGIRGLSFRVLIIAGMNEGIFPKTRARDPLLSEGTRENIGLSTAKNQYVEDRFLLSLMLRSAKERLILITARSDDGGRATIPSIFIRELFRHTHIGDPFHSAGANDPIARSYPRLLVSDTSLSRFREGDFRISALIGPGKDEELAVARSVISSSRFLNAGLVSIRERSIDTPPSTYDGVIGKQEGIINLVLPLNAQKLERYAACPFAFFMEYVISSRESLEPNVEKDIEAREMGSVYHRILSSLFGTLRAKGLLPLSGQKKEEILDVLEKILAHEISTPFSGRIPHLVLRARFLASREHLGRLIDYEIEFAADDGCVPSLFEVPYGLVAADGARRAPHLTIDFDGRPLPFAGRIDRIDIDEVRKAFRVIDYKKKKKPSENKLATEIKNGFHYQIPLYLLAAQESILPKELSPESGVLIFIECEEGTSRTDSIGADVIPELIEKTKENIGSCLADIQNGRFPVALKTGGFCAFCEFVGACRQKPGRRKNARAK